VNHPPILLQMILINFEWSYHNNIHQDKVDLYITFLIKER